MGQYFCTLSSIGVCHLSSSVTLPAAGRLGGRPPPGRACGRSGCRHCTAGQYGYVPLRRHLVFVLSVRCPTAVKLQNEASRLSLFVGADKILGTVRVWADQQLARHGQERRIHHPDNTRSHVFPPFIVSFIPFILFISFYSHINSPDTVTLGGAYDGDDDGGSIPVGLQSHMICCSGR